MWKAAIQKFQKLFSLAFFILSLSNPEDKIFVLWLFFLTCIFATSWLLWRCIFLTFYFKFSYREIILDLEKCCKNSKKNSHMLFAHLPLALTSYIIIVQLSKPRSWDWHNNLTFNTLYFHFTRFSTNVHFLFQDQNECPEFHLVIMSP